MVVQSDFVQFNHGYSDTLEIPCHTGVDGYLYVRDVIIRKFNVESERTAMGQRLMDKAVVDLLRMGKILLIDSEKRISYGLHTNRPIVIIRRDKVEVLYPSISKIVIHDGEPSYSQIVAVLFAANPAEVLLETVDVGVIRFFENTDVVIRIGITWTVARIQKYFMLDDWTYALEEYPVHQFFNSDFCTFMDLLHSNNMMNTITDQCATDMGRLYMKQLLLTPYNTWDLIEASRAYADKYNGLKADILFQYPHLGQQIDFCITRIGKKQLHRSCTKISSSMGDLYTVLSSMGVENEILQRANADGIFIKNDSVEWNQLVASTGVPLEHLRLDTHTSGIRITNGYIPQGDFKMIRSDKFTTTYSNVQLTRIVADMQLKLAGRTNELCQYIETHWNNPEFIQQLEYIKDRLCKLDVYVNANRGDTHCEFGSNVVVDGLYVPGYEPVYCKEGWDHTLVISGRNGSGKSCFLKIFLLNQLLAQRGFKIYGNRMCSMIHDKIFARIGYGEQMLHGRTVYLDEVTDTMEHRTRDHPSGTTLHLFDEMFQKSMDSDLAAAELLKLIKSLRGRVMASTHLDMGEDMKQIGSNRTLEPFKISGYDTELILEKYGIHFPEEDGMDEL